MFRNRYQSLSKIERRTFWIALVIATFFTVFAMTVLNDLINAPNLRWIISNALPFVISIIAFIGAGLIFSGRGAAGAWLMQVGILLALIVNTTLTEGFGFSSAFIVLAVTLYISLQILKGRSASIALWTGITGIIALILLDTFWMGTRIPSYRDNLSASILSIILSLILVLTTITQFKSYTLRSKLLIFALGTGLVSILSVSIFTTLSIRQTLTRQTGEALASAANQVLEEIDNYISYNIATISAEGQNPQIVAFLKSSFGEQRASQDEIVAILNSFTQRDPKHIVSYTLIHRTGLVVGDSNAYNIGFSEVDRDYFISPRDTGKVFISPVKYSPTSSDHEFYIGVPVTDKDGVFIGVMSVRFRSSVLNEIIAADNGLAGEGSYSILLDEFNLILAHGTNPDWISHTLVTPDPETFALFQKDNRILRSIGGKDISLNLPDFSEKLQTLSNDKQYFTSTDDTWGAPVEVGLAKSTTVPFKLAYVQPQSIALATITQQQQVTVTVALITGLIILIVGFAIARTITNPLISLATVAEDITSGNLSARAQYEINDEVGALAKSFNRMTDQLQDTLGGSRGVWQNEHQM